ncbi:MAG TPA: LLM class F420-dependent oxidoreductase [Candidatus Dormibacteraeota bacterium]|nr:LLM class F420-dependent oxidoreductase [Candidatus Dormibacteraeota bacterium]
MRLRVLLEARHGATYDQILAMAGTVEEVGFDAFFRSDHYLGIDPDDPVLAPTDSWTTLAGLARETRRVRLGTLVTAATFRLPGALAITVATVDAMSGGRVELGIGAAWYEREHRMFGIPFPPLRERFDRLEEQLQIIHGLWTTPPGQRFSFAGAHYRIEECANFPRSAQSPHPTLIVGGSGPRRTPTLAARFADEFNVGYHVGLAERFASFRRICAEVGRDPATVRLSTCLPVCCGRDQAEVRRRIEAIGQPRLTAQAVAGGPEAVLERLAELAVTGVDTVYFHIFDVNDLDHIRLLGREVLPRAAGLTPSTAAAAGRP